MLSHTSGIHWVWPMAPAQEPIMSGACAQPRSTMTQRVEQFGFPIGAPARLAPGQRRQRRDHRPHVFRIDDDVAERRLHAPQAEQGVAIDAVILFQPRQQAGIFVRAFLAGDDPPIGTAAVDVLPDLLGEFRLRALLLEHAGVGRERVHHAVIGRLRDAAADRAGAETGDPMGEAGRLLGERLSAESEARAGTKRDGKAGAPG